MIDGRDKKSDSHLSLGPQTRTPTETFPDLDTWTFVHDLESSDLG